MSPQEDLPCAEPPSASPPSSPSSAPSPLPGPWRRRPPGFEIIPFGGYRTNGDVSSNGRGFDRSSIDLQIKESELYGVAFDIPLAVSLKLEVMVNRQESALEVDPGLVIPGFDLGDLSVTYAHVGLVWQRHQGQVQPYAVVSGGLARLDPQFAGLDAEDRASASLGGGVKVFFTPASACAWRLAATPSTSTSRSATAATAAAMMTPSTRARGRWG